MKRGREAEDREVEELAMANCSKLLSRVGPKANLDGRVYECKTCNKKFPSSQALGGHRARHKLMLQTTPSVVHPVNAPAGSSTADHRHNKTTMTRHGCSICGLEFAGGQALGGHMRRHRGDGNVPAAAVGLNRSSSNISKRVLCMDLNLTPYENDLKFGYQIQTMVPLLVL